MANQSYPNSDPNRLRSFGRRKTHGLSDVQEDHLQLALSEIGVPPSGCLQHWLDEKTASSSGIGLEIGFGDGGHFVARAREFPDLFWIGCEPFINGIVKITDPYFDEQLPNIALYNNDARNVLDRLPNSCLDRIAILYPDPWHKNKHHKRRIINGTLIKSLARLCKENGIVQVASDIPNYIDWTLRHFKQNSDFNLISDTPELRQRPFAGWPGTKYERKAIREGRTPQYLTYMRSSV